MTNQLIDSTTLMVATTRIALPRAPALRGLRSGPVQAVRGKCVQEDRACCAGSGEAVRWACSSIRRASTQATTPMMVASTNFAWADVDPAKREVRGRLPASESGA